MDFLRKALFLLLVVVQLFALSNAQFNMDAVPKNLLKSRKLPGLDVCGKSIYSGTKTINGEPAMPGEFPWMANIGYGRHESSNPEWLCGGSLITDQYIITAANCLDPAVIQTLYNPRKVIAVRLGELDLNTNVKDGATPIDFKVEKTIYHQQYDKNKKINDIGLVKIKGKVVFTELIRPICLPPPEFQNDEFVGHAPTVAGWGITNTTYRAPQNTRLLKAEVTIKSPEECRANMTSQYILRNAVIDNKVICASAPGTDACKGDSGSPLMLYRSKRNKPGNTFLLGTVSYGYYCALEGYPGVYTRVSEYMGWIIDNLDI